jgi:hypothetical protein
MRISRPEFPQKFISDNAQLIRDILLMTPSRHHASDRIHPARRGDPAANMTVSQLNNGSRCLSRMLRRTCCFPWTISHLMFWAADL